MPNAVCLFVLNKNSYNALFFRNFFECDPIMVELRPFSAVNRGRQPQEEDRAQKQKYMQIQLDIVSFCSLTPSPFVYTPPLTAVLSGESPTLFWQRSKNMQNIVRLFYRESRGKPASGAEKEGYRECRASPDASAASYRNRGGRSRACGPLATCCRCSDPELFQSGTFRSCP